MNVHKNARLTPAGRLAAAARGHRGGKRRRRRAGVRRVGAHDPEVGRARPRRRGHGGPVLAPAPGGAAAPAAPAPPDRAGAPPALELAPHRAALRALPVSTVVTVLRRLGLHRLTRLEPPRPVVRYERRRPGTLVHVDVQKLGRIAGVGHRIHGDRTRRPGRRAGWEYVHVAIDDCTRPGYAEVLGGEDAATTAGFLERAAAWFAALGVRVRRLLSDNGGNYRSLVVAACCRALRIRHRFTRPFRPQTNGKAERFIRTLLAEWAYGQAYGRSCYRTRALAPYLQFYNTERQHTALKYRTPLQRLAARSVNKRLRHQQLDPSLPLGDDKNPEWPVRR